MTGSGSIFTGPPISCSVTERWQRGPVKLDRPGWNQWKSRWQEEMNRVSEVISSAQEKETFANLWQRPRLHSIMILFAVLLVGHYL